MVLFAYLLVINATALILMHADKQKARKSKWRISEARLIWTAVFGGSIGILIGMYLFRHKIRHKKFTLGIPLILFIQSILLLCIVK